MAVKESAAQRVERIKREKDGLDVLEAIYRCARTGEPVADDDVDRLKWYGLYTQNRTLQDPEDDTQYFMLRIKLEGGELSVPQLRVIAELSKRYARQTAHITTRQDIQLHWIRVKDLPAVFGRLADVGLSTQMAAGDCPRNIVTCPVSGIDAEAIADTTVLRREVADLFRANKAFSNLPRKFKIGICGCRQHCIGHEIQDLAFVAEKRGEGVRFAVSVGGGLAKGKRIASHIGYVEETQVAAVAQAVAELYRDEGNRGNRTQARTRHLVDAIGIDAFTEKLHARLGFSIGAGEAPGVTPYAQRAHFGVHPALGTERSYVGCAVTNGTLPPDALESLADLMEANAVPLLRCTPTQNFVLCPVENSSLPGLLDRLPQLGFDPTPSVFRARALACTGIKYCKFAISETKDLAAELVTYLEDAFPDFKEPVSISVNGCPNACAHPYVTDLGLIGCKLKDAHGDVVSGFELIVGGHLEGEASLFGTKTGIKIASSDVKHFFHRLIGDYLSSGENSLAAYLKHRTHSAGLRGE